MSSRLGSKRKIESKSKTYDCSGLIKGNRYRYGRSSRRCINGRFANADGWVTRNPVRVCRDSAVAVILVTCHEHVQAPVNVHDCVVIDGGQNMDFRQITCANLDKLCTEPNFCDLGGFQKRPGCPSRAFTRDGKTDRLS